MFRIFKLLFLIGFACLLSFTCIHFKKYKTGGFRISKLMRAKEKLPFPEEISSYEMKKIFSQPFKYLDRGTQFYVFESEDQKYVLKLLREDRLSAKLVDRVLSNPEKKDRMKKKTTQFKQACQLALKILPNQTGMVFVHLQTSENLPIIYLIDRFQFRHLVDINQYCFVLQKKGVLIKAALEKAQRYNDSGKAKKIIHSFFQTILNRTQNKISNSDPNLFENFAVLNETVMEIDVGDFFFNPHLISNEEAYHHEVNRHAAIFRKWIHERWPDLLEYFDEKHQEVLKR